jgi:hypothetical protein
MSISVDISDFKNGTIERGNVNRVVYMHQFGHG